MKKFLLLASLTIISNLTYSDEFPHLNYESRIELGNSIIYEAPFFKTGELRAYYDRFFFKKDRDTINKLCQLRGHTSGDLKKTTELPRGWWEIATLDYDNDQSNFNFLSDKNLATKNIIGNLYCNK